YDDANRLLRRIDGRDQVTDYTYNDPGGRLTAVRYPATPSQNLTFGYDAAGRLTSLDYDLGTASWNYLANGLLAKQTTDQETGLIALAYRYSEPGAGRFLNRDPGGEGGVNLYGYVGAKPVDAVGPDGTRTDLECYQRLLDQYERCLEDCRLSASGMVTICRAFCYGSGGAIGQCLIGCVAVALVVWAACIGGCRARLADEVHLCERCD
ncbi:MAG: hypothetical protein HUU35_06650, partial [Armatimonadetes bacterium]|nr:hypothetical protein [Armatimonadota bacterium]